MGKSIKIDEHVYDDLDNIRGKKETFSQAITRLIKTCRAVNMASELLGEFPPVIKSGNYASASMAGPERPETFQ